MTKKHQPIQLPHERRIIERPRLLQALDRATERIVLIVAPAGYGKTVLARQWIDASDATWGWVRSTLASADIVFLASTIGSAVAATVPSLPPRVRARVGTLTKPEAEAQALAEIVAEE